MSTVLKMSSLLGKAFHMMKRGRECEGSVFYSKRNNIEILTVRSRWQQLTQSVLPDGGNP